jgi:glycosyltransferase involved in cell wall biosynthesis
MARPLVSVVIPFLDPPADFFREAVASVAAQDYRPIELLLVNDGSVQTVVALARQLASDSGVPARYIEHPGGVNMGSSATRNLGASAASGKYLAFLDADDVWVSTKLREQVAILERNPNLALVFGLTRYWYSWLRTETATPDDFVVNRGVERAVTMAPPGFVARFLRGRIIVPSTSNTLMRRDAFVRCGGFEASFRGMYDDQAFLVKLGLGHSVAGVPTCWDSYRQHAASMTARAADLEHEARGEFLTWVRHYCAANGIDRAEVWEAINKETWLIETAPTRDRRSRIAHRLKRSWLRFEESVVPARLRQRLWGRRRADVYRSR